MELSAEIFPVLIGMMMRQGITKAAGTGMAMHMLASATIGGHIRCSDQCWTTGKIALAHLNEFPDYYTRLERMEEEAKKFHKKKE